MSRWFLKVSVCSAMWNGPRRRRQRGNALGISGGGHRDPSLPAAAAVQGQLAQGYWLGGEVASRYPCWNQTKGYTATLLRQHLNGKPEHIFIGLAFNSIQAFRFPRGYILLTFLRGWIAMTFGLHVPPQSILINLHLLHFKCVRCVGI